MVNEQLYKRQKKKTKIQKIASQLMLRHYLFTDFDMVITSIVYLFLLVLMQFK